MKIGLFLAAMFFCNEAVFSQWTANEDPLTINELKLTKLQRKKIENINKNAKHEINSIKNNCSTEEIATKVDEITGTRIKEIRNILTQEQQIIWRKKILQNKPRRSITGAPYEKIVQ